MKSISTIFAISAMAALGSSVAMASTISVSQFKPRTLSVLVQVDAQGHATKVLPSVELTPAMQRLLVDNINQLVVGPATIKNHPVESTVIMNVALRAVKRKDGKYDAHFAYVSALPSPYGGAAHWSMNDRNQLALVSDLAGQMSSQHLYQEPPFQNYQPPQQPVQTTPPSSAPTGSH